MLLIVSSVVYPILSLVLQDLSLLKQDLVQKHPRKGIQDDNIVSPPFKNFHIDFNEVALLFHIDF